MEKEFFHEAVAALVARGVIGDDPIIRSRAMLTLRALRWRARDTSKGSPMISRARGALLGLACGDALGTTLEFTHPIGMPKYPTLATGPLTEIQGGGPFRVEPGQVTDDTMMACALAASLAAGQGAALNPKDVAERYAEWQRHTFDIGGQTSGSIRAFVRHQNPLTCGEGYWDQGGRRAAGNGSLMRTAPIGVFFADEDAMRLEASILDSAITHFDPKCLLACAAYNAAVAAGVRGERRKHGASPGTMFGAADRELDRARSFCWDRWPCWRNEIDNAYGALLDDLSHALDRDPNLYGKEVNLLSTQGYVRVAFRLSFWYLMNGSSFRESLIDVVNRGGDSDTNGAIVGGLLGAYYGEWSIPESWREKVLGALQNQAPGPLRDTYHPKVLLAMLDLKGPDVL